jgi:hypothetical protein
MNMGIFGVKRGLPNSFCPLTVYVLRFAFKFAPTYRWGGSELESETYRGMGAGTSMYVCTYIHTCTPQIDISRKLNTLRGRQLGFSKSQRCIYKQ